MEKQTRFTFRLTEDDLRKLEEVAINERRSLSSALRWMINAFYDGMSVSIPKIGTISSKGIKLNSFEARYGRKPVAGVDFDPDGPMCRDEHDYLTGEGIYAPISSKGIKINEAKK
jgi:hypothetical protein